MLKSHGKKSFLNMVTFALLYASGPALIGDSLVAALASLISRACNSLIIAVLSWEWVLFYMVKTHFCYNQNSFSALAFLTGYKLVWTLFFLNR